MNTISFKGEYLEKRHPSWEYAKRKTNFNDIFDYLQTKDIQSKISKLPKHSAILAETASPRDDMLVDILYLTYDKDDLKRIEDKEGNCFPEFSITQQDVAEGTFKANITGFLDKVLSLYSK